MSKKLSYEIDVRLNEAKKSLNDLQKEFIKQGKMSGKAFADAFVAEIRKNVQAKNFAPQSRPTAPRPSVVTPMTRESQLPFRPSTALIPVKPDPSSLRKTETAIKNTGIKGGQAGGQAGGQEFGRLFADTAGLSITSGLLSVMSGGIFASLSQFIIGSTALARESNKAQVKLNTSISAYKKQQIQRQDILRSSASIEEKAFAIGIDVGDMYEENTASASAYSGEISNLERNVRNLERAHEDSIQVLENQKNALDDNVRAIENQARAQIEAIRALRGYSNLTDRQQDLERDITQANLDRIEAIKRADIEAIIGLNNLIAQKEFEQDEINNKIKLVDIETKAVEQGAQRQVDALQNQINTIRAEIEARNNRFDIDIEPAKRQLEDLRDVASNVASGIGKSIKQSVIDDIEKAKNQDINLIDETAIQNSVDDMFKRFKGIVTRGDLTQTVTDLLIGGITDVSELEKTIIGFVDIVARGKSPNIEFGVAVQQLGEQFRSERAALGEVSGLTEEYLSEIIPAGLAQLQAQGELIGKNTENLTAEEEAYVKRVGIQKIAERSQGAFNEQYENGALSIEEFNAAVRNLRTELGEPFFAVLTDVLEALLPVIQTISTFVSNNPKLAAGIVLVVTAFFGLATILLGLVGFIALVAGAFTALATGAGPVILAIVLGIVDVIAKLIAIVAALKLAWDNDFGGIRTKLTEVWEKSLQPALERWWKIIQDDIIPTLGKLFDYISTNETLQKFAGFLVDTLVDSIESTITKIDAMLTALKALFDWIERNKATFDGFFSFMQNPAAKAVLKAAGVPIMQNGGMLSGQMFRGADQGKEMILPASLTRTILDFAGRSNSNVINNNQQSNVENNYYGMYKPTRMLPSILLNN